MFTQLGIKLELGFTVIIRKIPKKMINNNGR